MAVFVIAYGARQYLVMADYESFVVNSYVDIGGALSVAMDGFGKEQNFNVAFAVAKYNEQESGLEEQADYGSIKAYYEVWDRDNDDFVPIATRPCTLADFGLGDQRIQTPFFDAESFQTDII